jgi:hypothetical protein
MEGFAIDGAELDLRIGFGWWFGYGFAENV